jgi:hypothetical protein
MAGLSEEVSKFHNFSVDGRAGRKIRTASWDPCVASVLVDESLNVSLAIESNEDVDQMQAGGVSCKEKQPVGSGVILGPRNQR